MSTCPAESVAAPRVPAALRRQLHPADLVPAAATGAGWLFTGALARGSLRSTAVAGDEGQCSAGAVLQR